MDKDIKRGEAITRLFLKVFKEVEIR